MTGCFRRARRGMGVSPIGHGQDARATGTLGPVAAVLCAMSRRIGFAAALAIAALVLASRVEARRDFERYEVILQRRPFGFVPPDEAPRPAQPVATGPSFADRLQMVAITERGGRIRVGFVDNSVKPPRTYFLHVGDSGGDYTVVAADFEAETARIRRDGQEAQLAIRRGGRGGAGDAAAGTAAGRGTAAGGVAGRPASRRPPVPRATITREQVREEREAGLRRPPTAPHLALPQHADTATMAELPPSVREHAIRQYNMELIRAGGEAGLPLPIALTPEEDAKLVQEGVLAP